MCNIIWDFLHIFYTFNGLVGSPTARSHNMQRSCAGGPTSSNHLAMTMTGIADSTGLVVSPPCSLSPLICPLFFLPYFLPSQSLPTISSNPPVEWESAMMRKRHLVDKDGPTFFTPALIPDKVQHRKVLRERPLVDMDGTMFAPAFRLLPPCSTCLADSIQAMLAT